MHERTPMPARDPLAKDAADRTEFVADLVHLRRPLAEVRDDLNRFPWDCEEGWIQPRWAPYWTAFLTDSLQLRNWYSGERVLRTDPPAVQKVLANYEPILRRFLCGEDSAEGFEAHFLETFKGDSDQIPGKVFDIFDGLFADVDEYVADPDLRARAGGVDEDELRERVRTTYTKLFDRAP